MTTTKRKTGAAAPSRYRRVPARLWDDPVFRGLAETDKLVALFLMTGPQANRIGYYLLSPALAAETLNIEPATFGRVLERVCGAFGWRFDPAARVLWLPDWWVNNAPESANHLTGNMKDLAEVPRSSLLSEFCANVERLDPSLHLAFQQGLSKALVKPYGEGSPQGSTDHPPNPAGTRNRNRTQEQDREREGTALARDAFDLYANAWHQKYGRRPDKADVAHANELLTLTREHGIDGVRHAVSGYFNCWDDFVTDAKHPLGLLLKQFTRWAVEGDRDVGGPDGIPAESLQ